MSLQPAHRKRVKHYDEPGHVHELTFSCYQRMPLLTNDLWRAMFAHSIDQATQKHRFHLVAFAFMPEHVHLLVCPQTPESKISCLLAGMKKPFAFRVKKLLEENDLPLLSKLTVRERPGKTSFRFWQEGGGYDRNFTDPNAIVSAIEYVHMNPVRRGLVERYEDWKWSSAKCYRDDVESQDESVPTVRMLPPAMWDSTT